MEHVGFDRITPATLVRQLVRTFKFSLCRRGLLGWPMQKRQQLQTLVEIAVLSPKRNGRAASMCRDGAGARLTITTAATPQEEVTSTTFLPIPIKGFHDPIKFSSTRVSSIELERGELHFRPYLYKVGHSPFWAKSKPRLDQYPIYARRMSSRSKCLAR